MHSQTVFDPLTYETRGKEFVFGFMENGVDDPDKQLYFDITAYKASAQVTVVGEGFTKAVTVPAFSSERVYVPSAFYANNVASGSETVENKAISIVATDEVAVTATHKVGLSSDASLLIPIQYLGSEYFATSLKPTDGDKSQLLLVAVNDGTTINLTYPATVTDVSTTTVTLNAGEVFQVQSDFDLSGTEITGATCGDDFALFTGNKAVTVSGVTSHQFVQVPDYQVLSTRFVIPKTSNGTEKYKIVATRKCKVIAYRLNESTLKSQNQDQMEFGLTDKKVFEVDLLRGESHEFSSDKPLLIKSDGYNVSFKDYDGIFTQYIQMVVQPGKTDYPNYIYKNYYSGVKAHYSSAKGLVVTKTSTAGSTSSMFTSVVTPIRQTPNLAILDLRSHPIGNEYYISIATPLLDNLKINKETVSESSYPQSNRSIAPYWINDRPFEFVTLKLNAGERYFISHENGFSAYAYSVDPLTQEVLGAVPMNRSYPTALYHEIRFNENEEQKIVSEYMSIAEFLSRFNFCTDASKFLINVRAESSRNWKFNFSNDVGQTPSGSEVNTSINRSEGYDFNISFNPYERTTCSPTANKFKYIMDKSWFNFDFALADYTVCAGAELTLDGFYDGIMYDHTWKVYAPGSDVDEADKYLAGDINSVAPVFKSNVQGEFRIELEIADPKDPTCTYDAAGTKGGIVTVTSGGDLGVSLVGKTEYCTGETVTVETTNTTGSHLWSLSPSGNGDFNAGTNTGSTFSFTVLGPVVVNYETDATSGCGNTASLDLSDNIAPTPSVSLAETEICSGLALNLEPSADAGVTYTWSGTLVGEGYLPSDQVNEAQPLVTLPFEADGEFDVTVTVENALGCTNSATSIVKAKAKPYIVANAVLSDGSLEPDTYNAFPGEYVDLFGEIVKVTGHDYTIEWTTDVATGINSGADAETAITNAISENTTAILTVTDNTSGCYNIDEVDIVMSGDALSIDAIDHPTHYCDDATTILEPVVTGGSGDYNYSWTTVPADVLTPAQASVKDISIDLDPGSYEFTLTVTDANSLQTTVNQTVTFNVYEMPTVGITRSDNEKLCATHTVDLDGNAQHGSGTTFDHVWTSNVAGVLSVNNEGSTVVTGNAAGGDYEIDYVVTDEFGCSASDDIVISSFPMPQDVEFGTIGNFCLSAEPIELTTGSSSETLGTGEYKGDGVVAGVFTPADAGVGVHTLTYTYTTPHGCQDSAKIDVEVYKLPVVTFDELSDVCLDAADVDLVGGADHTGTGSFKNVTNELGVNGNLFEPSVAGVGVHEIRYIFTDVNGCQDSVDREIEVWDLPVIDAGADQNVTYGATVTIDAEVSNGTEPYEYVWSPSTYLSASDVLKPEVQSIEISTDYGVTVTDANGCVDSDDVFINVTSDAFSVLPLTDIELCLNESAIFVAQPSGGSGTYTYSWTSEPVGFTSTDAEITVTPEVGETIYTVVVNDGDNAPVTRTVTVTVYALPTVDPLPLDVVCQQTDDKVILGQAVAGSNPLATHTWTGDSDILVDPSVADPTVNTALAPVDAESTYELTYTVVDDFGCSATADMQLRIDPNPIVNAEDVRYISCDSNPLEIDGLPTGGSGVWDTHQWTVPSDATYTLSATDIQNPVFESDVIGPKLIEYTVTDSKGCSDTKEIIVVTYSNPVVDLTPNPTTACVNDEITLSGNPTGGNPEYIHFWEGDTDNLSPLNDETTTVDTEFDGIYNYKYIVEDQFGCKDSAEMTLTIYVNPVADISPTDPVVCENVELQLTGTEGVGADSYTYKWISDDINLINDPSITSPIFISPTMGDYDFEYVIIANHDGVHECYDTAKTTIHVNENPRLDLGDDVSTCAEVDVALNLDVEGGDAASYQIVWSDDTGDLLVGDPYSLPYTRTEEGTYTVTVDITDGNGCFGTDEINVEVFKNPEVSVIEDAVCAGSDLVIAGNPVFGTSQEWTQHIWSGDDAVMLTAGADTDQPTFNSTRLGKHYLAYKVIDGNNCEDMDSVYITVNDNPQPKISEYDTLEVCEVADLQLNVSTIGAIGGAGTISENLVYTWTGNGAASLNDASVADPVFNNATAGEYKLYVEVAEADGENCSGIDSIVVVVNPLPVLRDDLDLEVCAGEELEIVGNVEYDLHEWKGISKGFPIDNPRSATPVLLTTEPGVYDARYIATTEKGCVDSIDFAITVHELPDADAGEDIEAFNGEIVQLHVEPTGDYSYVWSDAAFLGTASDIQDPQTVEVDGTVLYNVTVTNNVTGCEASDDVLVIDGTGPLDVSITPDEVAICRNDSVNLTAKPQGGNPAGYEFLWTWIDNTVEHTSTDMAMMVKPDTTTQYIITLIDGTEIDGVPTVVKDTVDVTVHQLPVITLEDEEVCETATITLDPQPVTASTADIDQTTHKWLGSDLSAYDQQIVDFSVSEAGDYNLTYSVADGHGCENSKEIVVTVNPLPVFEIVGDEGVCATKELQINTNITNGITPAADGFQWDAQAGILNATNIPDPILSTPTDGDYTLQLVLTDVKGCTDSVKRTFKVYRNPETQLVADTGVCAGISINLDSKPTGGAGEGYSHEWFVDDEGYFNRKDTSVVVYTPNELENNTFTYSYVVTDLNNCTDTAQVEIEVYPAVVADITPDDAEVCAESELVLQSGLNSGTPTYNFVWSKYGTAFLDQTASSATFLHDEAGTIKVYYDVVDDNGCSASDSTNVIVNSLPEPAILSEDKVCQLKTMELSSEVEEGTPDFQYNWTITEELDFPGNLENETAADAQYHAAKYSVGFIPLRLDVEDSKGCEGHDTKDILVKQVPYPHPLKTQYFVYTGDTITINRNGNNAEGRVYEWVGDNLEFLDKTDSAEVVFSSPKGMLDKDTTYTLTAIIRDTAGGYECDFIDEILVSVWSRVDVELTTNSPYQCQGEDFVLEPHMIKVPDDMIGQWISTEGLIMSGTTGFISVEVEDGSYGNYMVEYEVYSEENDFRDTFDIELVWKPNPDIEISDYKAYYEEEIEITPTITSINDVTRVIWDTYSGTEIYVEDTIVEADWAVKTLPLQGSDSVYVRVEDEFMCFALDTMSLYVSDPISIEWTDTETQCLGVDFELVRPIEGGEGGFTYKWTDEEGNVVSESDTLNMQPTLEAQKFTLTGSDGLAPDVVKEVVIQAHYQIDADFTYTPFEVLTILDEVNFSNASFKTEEEEELYAENYTFVWDPLGDEMEEYNGYNFVYGPYEEMGTYNARLIAVDNVNGCNDTVVKPVEVKPDPDCFIEYPNAFVPNTAQDGVFNPSNFRGIVPETYQIKIFNRWGQELYNSTDINNGWEGVYKGKDAMESVYVYQTTAQCQDGKPYIKNGDVTLLR